MPELKIKRIHPDARLPVYASDGAACFDLFAIDGGQITSVFPKAFRTGLAFEVPPGWALMVYSRSGHGFKDDVRLANCVGVIDSDYRGEVQVKLSCDLAAKPFFVSPGDRIAQAMLVPAQRFAFTEVDELSTTARGAGGFGSTGA